MLFKIKTKRLLFTSTLAIVGVVLVTVIIYTVPSQYGIRWMEAANAAPLRSLFVEESDQIADMQEAGLSGDRSRIPVMIAVLTDPLKPRSLTTNSFSPSATMQVVQHPAVVRAALHALALLGATDALPVIDADLRDHTVDTDYAKVARARLVAENNAKAATSSAAQAATKISRFYRELGLTTADMNAAAAEYKQRLNRHEGSDPLLGVEAMREVADMVYQGKYDDFNTLPGVSPLEFRLDYPSYLKMQLAPLARGERVRVLVQGLARKEYRGWHEDYDMQLALDEGATSGSQTASQLTAVQLQEMLTHRRQYPKEGFEMIMALLSSTGDKQQSPLVERLSRDPDRDISHFARGCYHSAVSGRKTSFAPGY